jgi:hypothetical protein
LTVIWIGLGFANKPTHYNTNVKERLVIGQFEKLPKWSKIFVFLYI